MHLLLLTTTRRGGGGRKSRLQLQGKMAISKESNTYVHTVAQSALSFTLPSRSTPLDIR